MGLCSEFDSFFFSMLAVTVVSISILYNFAFDNRVEPISSSAYELYY